MSNMDSHIFRQLYSASNYDMIKCNKTKSTPNESVYESNSGFKILWKDNKVERIHVVTSENEKVKIFAFYGNQLHEMSDESPNDLKLVCGK